MVLHNPLGMFVSLRSYIGDKSYVCSYRRCRGTSSCKTIPPAAGLRIGFWVCQSTCHLDGMHIVYSHTTIEIIFFDHLLQQSLNHLQPSNLLGLVQRRVLHNTSLSVVWFRISGFLLKRPWLAVISLNCNVNQDFDSWKWGIVAELRHCKKLSSDYNPEHLF